MPWQVATAADSYRPATEDRLGAWLTSYGYLFAVADGVGGRPNGGPAAEYALRGIAGYARWPAFPGPRALGDLLRQIDLEIAAAPDGGETTAMTCAVSESGLSGATVGDSAAWWVAAEGVVNLTDGVGRKPWVGSGAARPCVFTMPTGKGTLLLMTDGVWKYGNPAVLAVAARSADLAAIPTRLIDAARLQSGRLQDDAAVVVARFRPLD